MCKMFEDGCIIGQSCLHYCSFPEYFSLFSFTWPKRTPGEVIPDSIPQPLLCINKSIPSKTVFLLESLCCAWSSITSPETHFLTRLFLMSSRGHFLAKFWLFHLRDFWFCPCFSHWFGSVGIKATSHRPQSPHVCNKANVWHTVDMTECLSYQECVCVCSMWENGDQILVSYLPLSWIDSKACVCVGV